MADFELALMRTLRFEGGYANDPNDLGGETMWGITERVARANGYVGEMKDLPLATTKRIYHKNYWMPLKLTSFNSQSIANAVYDCAVNCGTGTAGKLLQRTLNVLNKRGRLWIDLKVDGEVGTMTLSALNEASKWYEKDILELFVILRGAYHVEICEKREANEVFMLGWLRRLKVEVET